MKSKPELGQRSSLLESTPFSPRDDALFLDEMNDLTLFHLEHCADYTRVFPNWSKAKNLCELPYLHVSVFKHHLFRTQDGSIQHERILNSSATSSDVSSQILLDRQSSASQAATSKAILADFIGSHERPLIILDSKSSLLSKGTISARIAAALALRTFSTRLVFALSNQSQDSTLYWEKIQDTLDKTDDVLVYGFTWVLWFLWATNKMPASVRDKLANTKVTYVHSGGWKRLETERVTKDEFNNKLKAISGPDSKVIDYYGLVEQTGIIYPECAIGWRHVPVWADVFARDSYNHDLVFETPGQLQLMNLTPKGSPYHSVLTEDRGLVSKVACDCGRSGKRFKLLGRLPKAEVRGCANV